MPGPRFNKIGKTHSVSDTFLEPVEDSQGLNDIDTTNLKDGIQVYVLSERKEYYYDKSTDSFIDSTPPAPTTINQNNKNKVITIDESQLSTVDEAGIVAYINALDPPISIAEDENLYIDVLRADEMAPFVTEWSVAAGETITFPSGDSNADFTIDWGDGTLEAVIGKEPTHTYDTAGNYDIKVRGYCPVVSMRYNSTNTSNVLGVKSWGALSFRTMSFWGCSNFSYLPMDETPDFSLSTGAMGMFYNCSLTEIPSSLFKNAANVTRLDWAFLNNSITTLPAGLLDDLPKLNDLNAAFGQNSITAIPSGFLDNNTLLNEMRDCFKNNAITEVPSGLFRYNTNITNFHQTLLGNSIASVQADLFQYCSEVTNFYGVLAGNNLTSIPEALFKYNTKATDFSVCFQDNSITTLPENLFQYNTEATNFTAAFRWNDLTTIPVGIFQYNTKATTLSAAFAINSITSVPAGLFDNNTLVTGMAQVFNGNSTLEAIPAGLFDKNTEVTDFSNLFTGTGLIEFPAGLFDNNQKVTNFSSILEGVLSFTGSVPELWLRVPEPTGTNAFRNATNIANYANIPNHWKGL